MEIIFWVLFLFIIGGLAAILKNLTEIISSFKKKKPNYPRYISEVVTEILKDKYINDFISSVNTSDYNKDGMYSVKFSQITFFDKIVDNIHKAYKKEDLLSNGLFLVCQINSDEEIEHAKHLLNETLMNIIIHNFKWPVTDELLKNIIELDNQLISLGDKSEYSILKNLYSKKS